MMRTLFTLTAALFCAVTLRAQNATTDPEFEAKVRELISLTGTANVATQMLERILPMLKEMAPGVSDEVWKSIEADMSTDGLIEELVPIYVEEYTEAEIDAMLAFYQTPEGRSVVAKMPTVLQRSMEAGQSWGQRAAQRLLERLQEKGYAPKS